MRDAAPASTLTAVKVRSFTVKVTVAGLVSMFPFASRARTLKVRVPFRSLVIVTSFLVLQADQFPLSSLYAKVSWAAGVMSSIPAQVKRKRGLVRGALPGADVRTVLGAISSISPPPAGAFVFVVVLQVREVDGVLVGFAQALASVHVRLCDPPTQVLQAEQLQLSTQAGIETAEVCLLAMLERMDWFPTSSVVFRPK